MLVLLASVALALDAVDGRVARRTGTVSALGGRFDMEVDAFLILVLSVQVARDHGLWVLVIGAARYLLAGGRLVVAVAAGGRAAPLLGQGGRRGPGRRAPRRRERTAPRGRRRPRCCWWLWRCSSSPSAARSGGSGGAGTGPRGRRRPARVVARARRRAGRWSGRRWSPRTAGRRPARRRCCGSRSRGCCSSAWCWCCRPGPRGCWPELAGLALALLTLLRLLDVGFGASLGRPFDPLYDWGYAGSAVGLLRDSVGGRDRGRGARRRGAADRSSCWSRCRRRCCGSSALARRHRGRSARAVSAVGVAWVLSAVLGLQALPGAPVASTSTAALAYDRVALVRTSYRGQQEFTAALTADPLADVPAGDLLTGLRGQDVLLVFVESYGRVALEDPDAARHVLPALDPRHRDPEGGRLPRPDRLPRLPHLRRPQLAGPLHAPVRAAGGPPAALRRAAGQPAHDAGLRLPRGRAGAPSTSCRPTGGRGPRATASTAGTGSTPPRTSATPGRRSATRRCRTSTSWTPSGASSSAPGTARR